MKVLLIVLTGVFGISMLAAPTLGAGWQWDTGNALGFIAFAGILYLGTSSTSRMDIKAHQVFGFLVLGIATLHAYWFLFSDAAVISYVSPGAPMYMWSGVLALLLLAALIVVGLPGYRRYFHKRYASFRLWHRLLAITVTVTAVYHIVASAFYLSTWYQAVLFVTLAAAVVVAGRQAGRKRAIAPADSTYFLAMGSLLAMLFVAIRNAAL